MDGIELSFTLHNMYLIEWDWKKPEPYLRRDVIM